MSRESKIKSKSASLVDSLDEMVLMDCIDEGLGVLGRDDERKVYWRLLLIEKMKESGANDRGILRDPDGFLKAVEETFGIGAWAIERAITVEIKKRFELRAIESNNLVIIIKAAMHKIAEIQNED
ncbi:MAG: hypothetical protein OK439_00755 [Thaumarchaeota archaeon]|nr:hypothetical protein [Nitrososphaerota archaeon]